jgi:raffinose/stachyose/melibiose transport system permease protein
VRTTETADDVVALDVRRAGWKVRRRSTAAKYLVLGALLAFTLIPLVFIWFTAFKPSLDTLTHPYSPPKSLYLDNFAKAWSQGQFGTYFLNSVRITVPVVLASLALSIPAGYAFACLQFAGRRVLLGLFLLGLMIPAQALLIPLFVTMRDLDLLDTRWSVVLAQTGFAIPFGIFIMRSFFVGLPADLLDAARMDGCSELRLLWHMALPLSMPAVLSLGIFQFVFSWNDFLFPLVFLSSDNMRTLPLGLIYFQGRYSTDWALTGAGVIIISLPVIALYVLLQRHFVRGIVAGSLRG